MGNTCTTRQQLPPLHQLKTTHPTPTSQRINTSGTQNFLPKMNALFSSAETPQSIPTKALLRSCYISPKILDQQCSLESQHLEIFQNLLRTQFKGNLFVHQNDMRSNTSIKEYEENVKEVERELSGKEIEEIKGILDGHFLFLQLSGKERVEIVRMMKLFEVENGEFIFKEGDSAERFFIVCEGEVEILIHGESKKVLGKNQSFGEIALLFGTKRTASIRALSHCLLWGIDGNTFKRVVNEINIKTQKQNRQFLSKTHFFNDLTPIQQQSVMNVIITLQYKPNQIIINQGNTSNSFFIIKSGEVIIEYKDGGEKQLISGNKFGEQSFDTFRENQMMIVRAKTECVVICLIKEQISEALGSSIEDVIFRNRIKKVIEGSKRFRVMYHKNFSYYVESYSVKTVTQGEKLLKKGHVMKNLYVPIDIELSTVDKKYQPGQIVEQNLLIQQKPLTHGIKANNSGSLLIIKPHPPILTQIKNFHSPISPTQLQLDNIQIIKKIGFGQFGQVYAGLHLLSNSLVAIKTVSKKTVQKYHIQRQIINQQISMKRINHPFLIKYFKTFVTKREIHFVIEYIEGEEFFDIIRKIGILKLDEAQFYVGQIVLVLEYLHNHNIVYRDLKPENIMVEKNGYLKLIDMGTAKVLEKEGYYKTRTVIGTPHYMSPETISGKGYSFLVDLWSLGIVIYQLVCGYFPYEQKHNDPFEIYKLILNKNLQFPGYVKDVDTKEIITKLLNKVPETRMSKGYNELKKMNFFKGLNWSELENKKLKAVYKIGKDSGINLAEIQRESLETMEEYFEKRTVKNNSVEVVADKWMGWENDLMDEKGEEKN